MNTHIHQMITLMAIMALAAFAIAHTTGPDWWPETVVSEAQK